MIRFIICVPFLLLVFYKSYIIYRLRPIDPDPNAVYSVDLVIWAEVSIGVMLCLSALYYIYLRNHKKGMVRHA